MMKKPLPSYEKVYQNYTKMRIGYFIFVVVIVISFTTKAIGGKIVVFSAPNVWAAIMSLLLGLMPWYVFFAMFSFGCHAYFKDIIDKEESLESVIKKNRNFSDEEINNIKGFKWFFFYPYASFLFFAAVNTLAKALV